MVREVGCADLRAGPSPIGGGATDRSGRSIARASVAGSSAAALGTVGFADGSGEADAADSPRSAARLCLRAAARLLARRGAA
jgi:hypothetical protein